MNNALAVIIWQRGEVAHVILRQGNDDWLIRRNNDKLISNFDSHKSLERSPSVSFTLIESISKMPDTRKSVYPDVQILLGISTRQSQLTPLKPRFSWAMTNLMDAQRVTRLMASTLSRWLARHHLPTDGSVRVSGRITAFSTERSMMIDVPSPELSLGVAIRLGRDLYRELVRLVPKSLDDVVFYVHSDRVANSLTTKLFITMNWRMEVESTDAEPEPFTQHRRVA